MARVLPSSPLGRRSHPRVLHLTNSPNPTEERAIDKVPPCRGLQKQLYLFYTQRMCQPQSALYPYPITLLVNGMFASFCFICLGWILLLRQRKEVYFFHAFGLALPTESTCPNWPYFLILVS